MLSRRSSAFAGLLPTLVLTLAIPLALAQSGTPPATSSANTSAQQPAAEPELTTQEEVETFHVKVNLVEVRVVVRDKNGNAVGNLKKEDFQLFDNGKPQVISRFSVEQADVRTPLVAGSTAVPANEGPKAIEQQRVVPRRYVSYLFDDVHLSAIDVMSVRNAAKAHLRTLSAEDRAAIYTTSGQVMLDFTDDRDKLYSTLDRIRPMPVNQYYSVSDCPNISPYQADLILNKHDEQALRVAVLDGGACGATSASAARSGGDAEGARQAAVREAEQVLNAANAQTRLAFDTLRAVVGRTAEAPGQKLIVLISPGFLLDNSDLLTESQIVDKALRANIVISALDARGLFTTSPAGDITHSNVNPALVQYVASYEFHGALAQEDVMQELAYSTGGSFFRNNNDLTEGLRRVSAAPEYSYLMGFSPQNLKADGSFHTLKVTLASNQKFTLQARKGYFAPKKNEDAAEQAKSEIAEQVFSQDTVSELPILLKTQFFKTADNNAKLAVLVNVDVRRMQFRKENGRNINDVTVVSVIFDRNGNVVSGTSKTVKMHITDETLATKMNSGITLTSNFDVSPGNYLIRVVVRDAQGKLSAQNGVIEIP